MSGLPSNRKVRARVSPGGSFTKGNRYSVPTGGTPIATDFRARNSGFYGVNSALPVDAYKGPLKKARGPVRQGAICPGCGITKPLSGQCNQCWD